MELNQFYNAAIPRETSFGMVRFSPINVDFWVRLLEWHEKSFGEVQRLLSRGAGSGLEEAKLLEVLTCLVHTATYPYLREQVSFDAWKDACFNWVVTDPAMVEWFLKYLESFMPALPGGRVKHPKEPAELKEFSWSFLNDVAVYAGLSPEAVRNYSLKALYDLMDKASELEKLRLEVQAKSKIM